MGFQSSQAAIEVLFGDNWSYTPITYEGVTYDPKEVDEYVRISVQEPGGNQGSCGTQNVLFRYRGTFQVQIFIRDGQGSGRALELADLVTPIFRSKIVNGIHYGVPAVVKVGPSNAWYQVNVICEFYREEFQ